MNVSELLAFPIREIRQDVLEKLKQRIKERGYNVAKSLIVDEKDGQYFVADGNHRLEVLKQQDIKQVPCVVYKNADIYKLAIESNQDEDVYASMDLFDWLDVIRKLKDEGYTQQQIGDKIGWSRQQVSLYLMLSDKIATTILNSCKQHQLGRVAEDATMVAFNFTERWFRDSGLYDIPEYQERLINGFIADKCNWNKSKVQSESSKYKLWQDMILTAKKRLVNQDGLESVIELIENGTFKTLDQLISKVNDFNKKAKNKLMCGDALIELEKLEDASIDIVITDPPYGIDYKSNRSKYDEHVTKNTVKNDNLVNALSLLDKTCSLLQSKTKTDAHIYMFTSWKVYPEFKNIIEKYFSIKNMIVWDKGNHGAGDLDNAWGNRHEVIVFATKGNRLLNTRKADIIVCNKLSSNQMIHPTQKPVELIKQILEVSAINADTVCDPFMGSGSTIKATIEYGGLNYIGIEIDRSTFDRASSFIGGNEA